MPKRSSGRLSYIPDGTPPPKNMSLGWSIDAELPDFDTTIQAGVSTPIGIGEALFLGKYPRPGREHTPTPNLSYLSRYDSGSGTRNWTHTIQGGLTSDPIIFGDLVLVWGDSTIYSVELTTGNRRWSIEFKEPPTGMVTTGDMTVVSTENVLVAIDATGDQLWSRQFQKDANTAPAVADGIIYLGTADGSVKAYDISDGSTLWEFVLPPARDADYRAVEHILGQPCGVFVPLAGQVYAIDASGTVNWKTEGGNAISATGSTLLAGGNGTLKAIKSNSGSVRWTKHTYEVMTQNSDTRLARPPVIVGETAVFLTMDGWIGVIDITDGTKKWVYQLPEGMPFAEGKIIVLNGTIFVTSNTNMLLAFEAE